jgi:hypothetical protein
MISIATGALPESAQAGGVNALTLCSETGAPDPVDAERCLLAIKDARKRVGRHGIVMCAHHNHQYESDRTIGDMYKDRRPPPRAPASWLKPWIERMVSAGLDIYLGSGDPKFYGFGQICGKPCFFGLGSFCFQVSPDGRDKFGKDAFEGILAAIYVLRAPDQSNVFGICVSAIRLEYDLRHPHYGLPARSEDDVPLRKFMKISKREGSEFERRVTADGTPVAFIVV